MFPCYGHSIREFATFTGYKDDIFKSLVFPFKDRNLAENWIGVDEVWF